MSSGELVPVLREQVRQHVLAVEQDAPHPREVVEPDLVDDDARGSTPSQSAKRRWKSDRDVAEADGAVAVVEQGARHDADGVREVDDPGFRRRERRTRSAISSTTGTVRIALAKPPAPVVSCPMQPQASGAVSSCSLAS